MPKSQRLSILELAIRAVEFEQQPFTATILNCELLVLSVFLAVLKSATSLAMIML